MNRFLFKYFILEAIIKGTLFASIMCFAEYLRHGRFETFQFLFYFFGFGIFMGLFNTLYLKYSLEKVGIMNLNEEYLSSLHSVTLPSSIKKEEIIKRIQSDHHFYKTKLIDYIDHIVIQSKRKLFSWGSPITIKFKNNDRHDHIIISTEYLKPVWSNDALKNLRNLNNLKKLLEEDY